MQKLAVPIMVMFLFVLIFVSGRGQSVSAQQDSVRIQVEQNRVDSMFVLYIRDTAVTTAAIKEVTGRAYTELMKFTGIHRLPVLQFMAYYYTMGQPWVMDIAVQITKVVPALTGRIQSRVQQGGTMLIAHMKGPYNQVGKAYAAIERWMIRNKLKPDGYPFEVYLNDPALVATPADILTDVYQPVKY